MSGPELITQFTEDAFAKEDRVCQRSSCQVRIQMGEPCHYVMGHNVTQPGKYVCGTCFLWYRHKPATTVHRQNMGTTNGMSSVNLPPVVAMTNIVRVPMPPPPLPSQHYSSAPMAYQQRDMAAGPDIYVPSAWNQPALTPVSAPSLSMALPAGTMGYGEQHLQYGSQRERWACMAHRPPSAETISLEISAVYEGGVRKKGARGNTIGALQSICEGLKDIDVMSTAFELATIALETVIPRIKAYYPQVHWREDEFIVQDAKWVTLSCHVSPRPYFYDECLHPSTHKNSKAMTFKTKQFCLLVVVPKSQWEEFEDFHEKMENTIASPAGGAVATRSAPDVPLGMGSAAAVTIQGKSKATSSASSAPSLPLFSYPQTTSTMSSIFD
ncbi:hypothetical protein PAXRUDRAFT_164433 [Paxillus rubicundulus Ve08.2h10]|uniref:Uncharacterized protein n=1 Tax=Paxillus rubicundulus Ve08.2h10 TaxID=930991 RepID=A0A0D0DJF7_9AGAM|nr:hypothetical protein PAXRUDRAFT_164433 [Paxillus rubicundulus Ve08.2h10]